MDESERRRLHFAVSEDLCNATQLDLLMVLDAKVLQPTGVTVDETSPDLINISVSDNSRTIAKLGVF